jgi:hypothetical protein
MDALRAKIRSALGEKFMERMAVMSWSFSVSTGPAGEFEGAVYAAYEDAKAHSTGMYETVEVQHQVEAAMKAAVAIVQSGTVGNGLVAANLNGHANPGHTPRPGYSHDGVNVNVVCAEPYESR